MSRGTIQKGKRDTKKGYTNQLEPLKWKSVLRNNNSKTEPFDFLVSELIRHAVLGQCDKGRRLLMHGRS